MQKSYKEIESEEFCPYCGAPAERIPFPKKVYLSGTKVENAEYNPGLGCVTKNKRDRDEIAKRKGLVAVGNDFGSGESMQKNFDADRERKRAKRWESD